MNKKKIPEFNRTNWWKHKDLARKGWRKPRGKHNKLREQLMRRGVKLPTVGYGADRRYRYLHPSGFKEALVFNSKDLEKLDAKKEAARIASSVGKRKRELITAKAKEMKIKLL